MNMSDSHIIGKTVIFVPGIKGGDVQFHNVIFMGFSTLDTYGGIDVDNHDYEKGNEY